MKRAIYALLFVSCASEIAVAQVLHVIVATDDQSRVGSGRGIGESCRQDRYRIVDLFENGLPRSRRNIVEIPAHQMTADHIMNTILALRIGRRDSVVFYYSGHGMGFDNEHYLRLTGVRSEGLARSDIKQAVLYHRPQFAALITDCCITQADNANPQGGRYGAWGDQGDLLLHHLFFNRRGVIDINSSRPFQTSVGTDDEGGVFTIEFVSCCKSNRDRRLDWPEMIARVRGRVARHYEGLEIADRYYREGIPQNTQTVHAFPENSKLNQPRFGMNLNQNGQVMSVVPGSASHRAGLRPGLFLTRINNHRITSQAEARIAMMFCRSGDVDVIARTTNGSGQTYRVSLPW